MSEPQIKLQKPLAIIIICFIGMINATQLVFMVLSPVSKQLNTFYPVFFSLSAILSFASIAGMWFMKKWAALLYSLLLICNQLVLVSMNLWEISAVLIPMIILILLFNNKNKMV